MRDKKSTIRVQQKPRKLKPLIQRLKKKNDFTYKSLTAWHIEQSRMKIELEDRNRKLLWLRKPNGRNTVNRTADRSESNQQVRYSQTKTLAPGIKISSGRNAFQQLAWAGVCRGAVLTEQQSKLQQRSTPPNKSDRGQQELQHRAAQRNGPGLSSFTERKRSRQNQIGSGIIEDWTGAETHGVETRRMTGSWEGRSAGALGWDTSLGTKTNHGRISKIISKKANSALMRWDWRIGKLKPRTEALGSSDPLRKMKPIQIRHKEKEKWIAHSKCKNWFFPLNSSMITTDSQNPPSSLHLLIIEI
jgi:hypothetical protein